MSSDGREIGGSRDQMFLLPPSLDDWVPMDHAVRFIDELVESLDLASLGIEAIPSAFGRPRYAPRLLLKLWLYAYYEDVRSSRKLERACQDRISFRWLSGNELPDHNTLWRFFRQNRKALGFASRHVVRVAAQSGLVGLELHAVDGTKLQACSSNRTALHRTDLERRLAEVTRWLERIDESENDDDEPPPSLPIDREGLEALRETITESLSEMAEESREHLHPGEPECEMVKIQGQIQFGYNAQVAVDGDSGLIVANDVIVNGADNHALVPMLEEVEASLGQVADDTVADGGYVLHEALAEANSLGYEVTVPIDAVGGDVSKKPFHVSKFQYDATTDEWRCPVGGLLERIGEHDPSFEKPTKYRCRNYEHCAHRWECSPSPRGRSISVTPHFAAALRHREKVCEPETQARLRRRQAIVEPAFGWVKANMGFRRWTYCGLESVRAQWALLCMAVNLRKMVRSWRKGLCAA